MENNKAVEVLREMKLSAENPKNICWLFNNDRDKAINEALLTLEKRYKALKKLDDVIDWIEAITFNIKDFRYEGDEELIIKDLNRTLKITKEVRGWLK